MKTTLSKASSILLYLTLIFLMSSCNSVPTFTPQDEAAIRATIDKALGTFNETGDMIAYTEIYYAEDATMHSPNAEPIKGRKAIQEFGASFPRMTNDYTVKEVYGQGDMAYVVGTYHLIFEDPTIPEDRGKYIEIWRRQKDGSWKITHDIFNTSLPMAEQHDQEANM